MVQPSSLAQCLLAGQQMKIALQVNGKLRGMIEVDPEILDDDLKALALGH